MNEYKDFLTTEIEVMIEALYPDYELDEHKLVEKVYDNLINNDEFVGMVDDIVADLIVEEYRDIIGEK